MILVCPILKIISEVKSLSLSHAMYFYSLVTLKGVIPPRTLIGAPIKMAKLQASTHVFTPVPTNTPPTNRPKVRKLLFVYKYFLSELSILSFF